MASAVSPSMDALADRHLSAHMLEHVLIGDLAPALVAVALTARIRAFRLPGPVWSFGLWAIALGVWHLPVAYDLAEAHRPVHVVEHGCFVLVGLLAWGNLVRLPTWESIGLAVAMLAAGMFLTTALIAGGRPLYAAYPSLGDQQLAALLMTGEQLLTLGALIAVRLRSYARLPHVDVAGGHPFSS